MKKSSVVLFTCLAAVGCGAFPQDGWSEDEPEASSSSSTWQQSDGSTLTLTPLDGKHVEVTTEGPAGTDVRVMTTAEAVELVTEASGRQLLGKCYGVCNIAVR